MVMATWRKHSTHAEETRAVKNALVDAGWKTAKVSHGSGTAWGWLHIKVSAPKPTDCFCGQWREAQYYATPCSPCTEQYRTVLASIIAIAQRVTGRHGKYDGDINVDIRTE